MVRVAGWHGVCVNAMMPALSVLRAGDEVETVECYRFDFDRARGLMWEGPPRFPYSGATSKIVGPARWQSGVVVRPAWPRVGRAAWCSPPAILQEWLSATRVVAAGRERGAGRSG